LLFGTITGRFLLANALLNAAMSFDLTAARRVNCASILAAQIVVNVIGLSGRRAVGAIDRRSERGEFVVEFYRVI
jgi:hypothetical protein